MRTKRPIAFQQGRTDVVTAVLVPMDGVTRIPVRTGVDAQLWDRVEEIPRSERLIRNLSGQLVLLNHPADQQLTFRIDPTRAGYRGPLFITFTPAADGVSRIVALERRPDSEFDATLTLVRGSVVRSAGTGSPAEPAAVSGLRVTASPQAGAAGHQFPVTTDERGVFALVVGLKRLGATDEAPAPVRTVLRFEKAGLPVRDISVDLDHGRTHVFAAPVDLDRDDRPPFTHPVRTEEPEHDE
jgi:hypothetical protein